MRKMKKNFLIIVLCLVVFVLLIGITNAEETKGTLGDLLWEIDKSGKLTIGGKGSVSDGPWAQYKNSITGIEFGDGISRIEYSAFWGYKNLTHVIIGENVERIEDTAFLECKKIKTFEVRSRFNCFNPLAFSTDISSSIILSEESPYLIEDNMLITSDKHTLIYYLGKGKAVIPDTINKVGRGAFWEKDNITDIVLPGTVTDIETIAFGQCDKLMTVEIHSQSIRLGGSLFQSCHSLKTVSFFSDQIEFYDYGYGADSIFTGCSNLEAIILPSCNKIPLNCFYNCPKIKKIIISEGTEKISDCAIGTCPSLEILYIPESITYISDNAIDYGSKKLVIYCDDGSYAQTWAESRGYKTKTIVFVSEISLNEYNVEINKGKSFSLKADILPIDAAEKKVEWFSTDPAIATVNNGNVKAISCGECDIICRATDGSGSKNICHISVIQMVQSIQVEKKNLTIPYGDSFKLTVTIKPDDATNQILNWTSSNTEVCTISEDGIITAVGVGDCEIIGTTMDGSNKSVKIAIHVAQ